MIRVEGGPECVDGEAQEANPLIRPREESESQSSRKKRRRGREGNTEASEEKPEDAQASDGVDALHDNRYVSSAD